MTSAAGRTLRAVLVDSKQELLEEWVQTQLTASTLRADLIKERELRDQSQELLELLRSAAREGALERIDGPEWTPLREFLARISRTRVQQGFTVSAIATFVLSLKQPVFARLRAALKDAESLGAEMWLATTLLDRIGLYTVEMFLKTREDVIQRQQREMMELSTPVVELWENILALPLIGTLDSERTQVVMESLLQKIVETGAAIAIIDITGVPTVDTLVAQHLLKTVAAARLMGADCIISGIRPQIAQTIVHLGVNLSDVTTKASLSDAFAIALKRTQAKQSAPQAWTATRS
jgi:rsbT co-antagonist protein RsbR